MNKTSFATSFFKKIFFLLLLFWGIQSITSYAYYSLGQPTGFVNDYANILTNTDKTALEQLLSNYQKTSSNEVVIVTINSLEDDTIENFANKLFREWGIGNKEKDNGLLFLIAIEDRKMRIETGYGLEPYLTDLQTFWIQEKEVKPYFKQNQYAEGIKVGAEKIIAGLSGTETIPSLENDEDDWGGWVGFGFILFWVIIAPLISWLVSIFGRSKSWWLGGVVGSIIGLIIWLIAGTFFLFPLLGIIGLLFDYVVSKNYKKPGKTSWWAGGNKTFWDSWGSGSSGGGGSSFGGFGGGSSGGGGSSSSW